MAKKRKSYDVIVVGGGLAGLTMTALLAARGARALCLDRDAPQAQLKTNFDGRTTAISWGSRKVMRVAGVWKSLEPEACAIETIQILDGSANDRASAPPLTFASREVGNRAFGWIVENRLLRQALLDRVRKHKNAGHIAPALVADFAREDEGVTVILKDGRAFSAPLVIGADGRDSFTREWMGIGARAWRYDQRAIVCVAEHENPHDNVAVEHFRAEGPFAILPMTDGPRGVYRSSVVWTEHVPARKSALRYDQDSFDAALQARFPAFYGAVKQSGGRFSYPLGLIHAHNYVAPRMALVAESAHGIHPIAGQGLNMGFRDIAALAGLVGAALDAGDDPGSKDLLSEYQRQRRFDNMAMAGATDSLNRLFSNDIGPVRIVRSLGLRAVARLPGAKQFFMKQAMGAAGLLPGLMRDAA